MPRDGTGAAGIGCAGGFASVCACRSLDSSGAGCVAAAAIGSRRGPSRRAGSCTDSTRSEGVGAAGAGARCSCTKGDVLGDSAARSALCASITACGVSRSSACSPRTSATAAAATCCACGAATPSRLASCMAWSRASRSLTVSASILRPWAPGTGASICWMARICE